MKMINNEVLEELKAGLALIGVDTINEDGKIRITNSLNDGCLNWQLTDDGYEIRYVIKDKAEISYTILRQGIGSKDDSTKDRISIKTERRDATGCGYRAHYRSSRVYFDIGVEVFNQDGFTLGKQEYFFRYKPQATIHPNGVITKCGESRIIMGVSSGNCYSENVLLLHEESNKQIKSPNNVTFNNYIEINNERIKLEYDELLPIKLGLISHPHTFEGVKKVFTILRNAFPENRFLNFIAQSNICTLTNIRQQFGMDLANICFIEHEILERVNEYIRRIERDTKPISMDKIISIGTMPH